jgi:hypothetical protein
MCLLTQPYIELPLVGNPLTLRYLGQYAQMFDNLEEEPIPTWPAILWLLEDYGFSRTEEVPADIHYRRISRQWSAIPPVAVTSHPHYNQSLPSKAKMEPDNNLVECRV